MADYVLNVIEIHGTDENVQAFLNTCKGKDPYDKSKEKEFTFDSFIQMPEDLHDVDEVRDWCRENWGSRSDAYDETVEGNTIRFYTAWTAAEPVVERMAKMFPNIDIDYSYAFENREMGGMAFKYSNSQLTALQELDAKDACRSVYGENYNEWRTDLYDVPYSPELSKEMFESAKPTLTSMEYIGYDNSILVYADISQDYDKKILKRYDDQRRQTGNDDKVKLGSGEWVNTTFYINNCDGSYYITANLEIASEEGADYIGQIVLNRDEGKRFISAIEQVYGKKMEEVFNEFKICGKARTVPNKVSIEDPGNR